MARRDDDEILKKLFDRFFEPDTSNVDLPPAPKSGKQPNADLRDWRDPTGPAFGARCEPRSAQAPYSSPGLALYVSQWIRQDRKEKLWDSVIIRCDEEVDGTMTVRVLISNPDWNHSLQIACIRSRPGDTEWLTPLACNLDHEEVL